MNRTTRNTLSDEELARRRAILGAGLLGGLALAAGGWHLYNAGHAARLANHAIALQERLLTATTDPGDRRRTVDEIMRSVDRLPPAEVKRIRDALFKRINTLRRESLERFAEASPDERTALLDEDIDRIRLVRGILDATDQGGMRPYTEAEILEREQRRKQRDEETKQAKAAAPKSPVKTSPPAKPRPPTAEQKQTADYMEALTKRAKEKKVDLGRMFSRPPGRG